VSGLTVNDGGTQAVSSGGSAISATISSGGNQNILSGGIASATTVNGGLLNVFSGGLASYTSVSNGGIISVSAGGSSYYTQIYNGGQEIIGYGGYGPFATIYSGGLQTIRVGGLDSGSTILAGGVQIVSGEVRAAQISGTQIIHAGGSGLNGIVYSGGLVNASSGSTLLDYQIVGDRASITAAGNVSTSSSVGGLAISVAGSDNSVTLNGASLGAGVLFNGSDNALTLANNTVINEAITLTDGTGSNTLTLANQHLMLANTGTSGAAVVSGWRIFNINSDAAVTLAGNTVNLVVGAFSNAGKIMVGATQNLNVTGGYSQAGTLGLGFNSPSAYGKMVVSGNAILGSGAQIAVSSGSVLAQSGDYKNVFRATGTTTGAFVSSGSYGLTPYTIVSNGSGFDLVTGKSSPGIAGMTPLLNGGQPTAILNQAQASVEVIRNRMDRMDDQAHQSIIESSYAWVAPFGNSARQSGNGAPSAAYTQNTAGIAFGADTSIDPDLRLGLATTFAGASANGLNLDTGDSLTTTSYQLTAYAKQNMAYSAEIRFILNGAYDQNNSKRLTTANAIPQNASAKYGGWHGLASVEGSQNWQWGDTTLTPLIRLDYSYASVNGYDETGAAGSNLIVSGQKGQSMIAGAGGRMRFDLNETNHMLFRTLIGYDFAATPSALQARDVSGIAFTTAVNKPGALVTQVGVSYEINPKTKNDLRLRLNYDYFGRTSGYNNNAINLNLIVPFK
jgi:autotransporter passenger strand-loop-strand repeat protein